MGEAGMAWRCLPSSRNEQVSACAPTEKKTEERSEDVEGYDTGKTDRQGESEGEEGDLAGPRCRDGFSRESGEGEVPSLRRTWVYRETGGPPGFEERRNV